MKYLLLLAVSFTSANSFAAGMLDCRFGGVEGSYKIQSFMVQRTGAKAANFLVSTKEEYADSTSVVFAGVGEKHEVLYWETGDAGIFGARLDNAVTGQCREVITSVN